MWIDVDEGKQVFVVKPDLEHSSHVPETYHTR